MTEFILPHGTPESENAFNTLDAFTQGYIEAMFFTSTGTGDDDDLEHVTTADLAPETVAAIAADCTTFQTQNAQLLTAAYEHSYEPEQAGRDLWFTRNHHGVGYWDHEDLPRDLGDSLTHAAHTMGETGLCLGDDERLYLV